MRSCTLVFLMLFSLFPNLTTAAETDGEGWPNYGHDAGGTRYSSAKQIVASNLNQLQVAWTYHTGALDPPTKLNGSAAFEATPILVNRTLYLSTPLNQVIALDAVTGAKKWRFDPQIDHSRSYSEVSSRGVTAWVDSRAQSASLCRTRIFEGTIDARLIALDAETGMPCPGFGKDGQVDLTDGIVLLSRGDYQVTSPPTAIGDLIITGSAIGDNRAVNVESGVVRAFDIRTGQLRWTWDPIPWSKEQMPRTGAANAWSIFSADAQRDLIFVPTGSAGPDFFGGSRPGNDEHANSVVALRASTGALVWSFQVVHHDLWDYDVPSQPILIRFKGRDAVAVTTKIGHLFVLDRDTGKPLHEVTEKPVPASDVPEEQASPTQPFPAWPALVPQKLEEKDLWAASPEARQSCEAQFRAARNDGLFTPPSLRGTVLFPGNIGGVNWGGAAWDIKSNLLITNTNRLATIVKLIPREQFHPGANHPGANQGGENRVQGEYGRQAGTPYAMHRDWLLSPERLPCNAPPWGALVAFDLAAGKVLWQTPLGEVKPGLPAGSPNLGGPIVTAGGLVFTAGAMDTYLRAFDASDGKELWKATLPASAQSTPMTYQLDGIEYVVICAGGHGKLATKMGDAVVAFALAK